MWVSNGWPFASMYVCRDDTTQIVPKLSKVVAEINPNVNEGARSCSQTNPPDSLRLWSLSVSGDVTDFHRVFPLLLVASCGVT